MLRLRLHGLSILALAASGRSETCYFPDGSIDTSGIPCPKLGNNNAVACCRESEHYCLTNGLCLEPQAWTMYRNSCTDKSFTASGCPAICRDDALGGYSGVNYCFDGPTWTCRSRNDCEKGNFTMPRPRGKIMLNNAARTDMGIAGTSTVVGASGTATAVATGSSGEISAGAAAGIGAGIGVPLAVAVGVLTMLLLREKRKSGAAGLERDGRRSQDHGASGNSQAWDKKGQTPQPTGYGHQAPTTELSPEPAVRHELPQ